MDSTTSIDPWKIGRVQNGRCSLSYKDTWVTHLPYDDNFQETLRHAILNPGSRAYVPLFKDGLFTDSMRDRQGIMNLVKAGLIQPMHAYEMLPELKTWLKRNDLWVEEEPIIQPTLTFNGVDYLKRGRDWYSRSQGQSAWLPLTKGHHFQSVYQARLTFARGEANIQQVIEYGWGPFLEVLGDQSALLTDISKEVTYTRWDNSVVTCTEQDTSPYKEQMHKLVDSILEEEPRITGFKYHQLTGLYEPVYNIVPLKTEPKKLRLLHELIDKVIDYEYSGRYAHLLFVNAYYKEQIFEKRRWERSCRTFQPKQYSPYLESYRKKSETLSLKELAAYIQQGQQELITLGSSPADKAKTTFTYRQNLYCLDIDSGKISFMNREVYIPERFHKWTDERKHQFLGTDYDALCRLWEKRSAAFARSKAYLHYVEGLSWSRANAVATRRHRRIQREFDKKLASASRWTCCHINKNAVAVQRQLPVNLWEVA